MTEKYVLEVDIDQETGEEHCTVLKTDGTTNMGNWIEIVSAMYTHHSILEPLIDELNKIQNNYNNTEKYAIKLWEENEELKQELSEQGTQIDFLKDENTHMRNVLNENKQLKQRNNRQAKQLDRLYNLIEEKDWRTLTDILDDFKRCEEQLQQEWKCYE